MFQWESNLFLSWLSKFAQVAKTVPAEKDASQCQLCLQCFGENQVQSEYFHYAWNIKWRTMAQVSGLLQKNLISITTPKTKKMSRFPNNIHWYTVKNLKIIGFCYSNKVMVKKTLCLKTSNHTYLHCIRVMVISSVSVLKTRLNTFSRSRSLSQNPPHFYSVDLGFFLNTKTTNVSLSLAHVACL